MRKDLSAIDVVKLEELIEFFESAGNQKFADDLKILLGRFIKYKERMEKRYKKEDEEEEWSW